MPLLQTGWINKKSTIEAVCDLVNGWHKLTPYSYGYCEQDFLDFPGDYKIRLEVKVICRPNTLNPRLQNFPVEAANEVANEGCDYHLKQGRLTLRLRLQLEKSLDPDRRWFITSNNKLAFDWIVPEISASGVISFEMHVLVVFWPPKGKGPSTERDWERRFFPGGLPTLGKRR